MKFECNGSLLDVSFKAWHKPSKRWETFTFHDIESDEMFIYVNGNKIEEYEDLIIED